jgi:predicted amidophosphoribosyltransferase
MVFLSIAQKYFEYDGNLFIEKLSLLMHGFKEQKEISIETLMNDEFSSLVQSLSYEDKKKFEKILKVKLEQYQYT